MNKIAVCVPPAWCDAYGHLTRYAAQLAETGAARGAAVDILHYDSPDFMARLFSALQDEEAVVHFHAFLYDLSISASPAKTRRTHVLENARATVLATISDHPFTDFMQNMIRDAHPNTNFIVLEKTFPDEMQAINPALKDARFDYQPFGPPQNYERAFEVGFSDRQFDLVVPVRIVDLTDRDIKTLLDKLSSTWLVKPMSATYETCVADISRNPFHVFIEYMSAALGGASFEAVRAYKPDVADLILNAMSAVDGLVRQERRHRMVKSLLRSVGNLKVAVLCDPIAGLDADENVQFLGIRQTTETIKLMADTRALLNCNPTYPSNLHERVTVGMMYGSCVITDVNPYIAENFSYDEILPYIPGSSRTIADLFADHDIEAVGAAAANRVRGDRAFSWDGHFDELTRVVSKARQDRVLPEARQSMAPATGHVH